METKEKVEKYLVKWLKPLGLLWWETYALYIDDPRELAEQDYFRDGDTILARTFADWRYGTIKIYFNVPAIKDLEDIALERLVVHELVHALVNEMREEGIDHEERVVSGLTKAFFWTEEGLYGS